MSMDVRTKQSIQRIERVTHVLAVALLLRLEAFVTSGLQRVGAVLAHRMPDASEKPIGYAYRTLNSAERNYSQEGLSLVFGIKRFYSYL